MTLAIEEFIRRILIHVLPKGFRRIRHYGLFAKPSCADNIARARQLLAAAHKMRTPVSMPKGRAHQLLSLLRRPHDHHRAF